MKSNLVQLKEILHMLSKVERKDRQDISIVAESGFDESSIVATEDSLLDLAEFLIGVVVATKSGSAESMDSYTRCDNGIDGYSSNEIKMFFSETADIWPVEICAVKDARSLGELIKHFRD